MALISSSFIHEEFTKDWHFPELSALGGGIVLRTTEFLIASPKATTDEYSVSEKGAMPPF
jgi:hypothetical protein